MECQQCKMTAGNIEAFSALCRQGSCKGSLLKGMHVSAGIVEGNASKPDHLPREDSQKQKGKKLKKLQSDIKKTAKKEKKHTHPRTIQGEQGRHTQKTFVEGNQSYEV